MNFLDDDYLLTTDLAQELFHAHAATMPVVDYHCHLHPEEIVEDPCFTDIVAAWLTDGNNYGDHYKWRLMRANGVPEALITGDGDPWEKFLAYATTMDKAIGSPVYLWTHMELRRYFGIEETLTEKSAKAIFDECNAKLATPEFSRRSLLRRMNVDTVCTTDDPVDDLHYHEEFAREGDTFAMLPAMRPDKALNPDKEGFVEWVERLEAVSGTTISSFDDFIAAMSRRIDFFHEHGSRLADHAADLMTYDEATPAELDAILAKARAGKELTALEVSQYRTAFMVQLMRLYSDKGWAMQIHLHAMRNVNTREFGIHGADTGYDAINDRSIAEPLYRLLDAAARGGDVPKMLIYSLNPNDYMAIATVMGAFQGDMKQRLSLGNAWWFNDTRTGIRRQLEVQAETSLLGNAVGMTTDSRSFLSFPRHEFFRRILCELIGDWAARGEVPNDVDYLAPLVENVSFNNAKELFLCD
ncbi:glucuronate isomerase [Bifidobacterium eulemuris]|uniref:Uronate isomerase n=1 Tax=Bifidobacterium eulemuris TaxID=1765219 RepID=A0A261G7U2_9BIFI|nr:glucuronate isomerase [Bifidobacterium eulemuris]OZG67490.1 glucuronate isomerase [Bifidobacterium eulemuris]QOL31032.1 glucuronate isomerase [Bifidobacterium eulemuris]QOL33046.1 glucuronate isomerase [Bifidobacterium eulemuris]